MTYSTAHLIDRMANHALHILLRVFAVLLVVAYAVAALRLACMLGGMTP